MDPRLSDPRGAAERNDTAGPVASVGPPGAALIVCDACDGAGHVDGAHFGISGMVDADGAPIGIPCIVCDGAGLVLHGADEPVAENRMADPPLGIPASNIVRLSCAPRRSSPPPVPGDVIRMKLPA